MTTYAYTRVSTSEQTTARQLDQLPTYDYLYEDKQSGKSLDRPQLQAMIDRLQSGDTVLVLSIDRLARNVDDLRALSIQMLEKNITLKFIKEGLTFADGIRNPSNTLVLTLIGAIAEFERALINNRCAEGRKVALANGVKFGKPSKLTTEHLNDIRSKRLTQPAFAKLYNVSVGYIAKIQGGKK